MTQHLLQRNVAAIAELEKAAHAQRSISERIAAAIGSWVATMSFVLLHAVVLAVWIYLNREDSPYRFDPFPYGILILVLAFEAIVLTTFVLIAQRHETRADERRSHLNLQISLLAEQEMTNVITTLRTISLHLGLPDEAEDETFRELAKETNVEHVAKVIDDQLADDAAAFKTGKPPEQ